jgi:hypothetical protein
MQAVLASRRQVKTGDQVRGGVQVAERHYFAGTHKMEEEGADAAPLGALLKESEAIRGRPSGYVFDATTSIGPCSRRSSSADAP